MSSPDHSLWADRLQVEGINFKGYGTVAKYAMRDRDLSITAKGIYAYFCAMSGSGNSTFPSLPTIQGHLKLGNKAYYRHRQLLIDQGYLLVTPKARERGEFSINLYTIVSNPKKFSELTAQNDWQSEVYSSIVQDGIKSAGYGEIPRSVMQDERMDVKAKAVYAYFASYAGSGRTAFPGVPQILADLGISKDTYQKAMRTLQSLGYIEVKQRNGCGSGAKKNGFGANSYHLIDRPVFAQPEKAQTVNAQTDFAQPAPAQTARAQAEAAQTARAKPAAAQTAKAHAIKNTSPAKNTDVSNNHPSAIPPAAEPWIDAGWDEEESEFSLLLKEQLDYDSLSLRYGEALLPKFDELILMMVTACEGTRRTVRIGGDELPRKKVQSRFLSLTAEHLLYVLECVERKRGQIRNIRAYYLAALYHAPETMDVYYENRIREDFEGPGNGADSF